MHKGFQPQKTLIYFITGDPMCSAGNHSNDHTFAIYLNKTKPVVYQTPFLISAL